MPAARSLAAASPASPTSVLAEQSVPPVAPWLCCRLPHTAAAPLAAATQSKDRQWTTFFFFFKLKKSDSLTLPKLLSAKQQLRNEQAAWWGSDNSNRTPAVVVSMANSNKKMKLSIEKTLTNEHTGQNSLSVNTSSSFGNTCASESGAKQIADPKIYTGILVNVFTIIFFCVS